jgi:hypothetical protein
MIIITKTRRMDSPTWIMSNEATVSTLAPPATVATSAVACLKAITQNSIKKTASKAASKQRSKMV